MTVEELNNPESKYIDFKIIKAESNMFYNESVEQYKWGNNNVNTGEIYVNIESPYDYQGNPWFYAVLKLQGEDVIMGLNRCFSLNIQKNIEIVLYKHKDLEVVRSTTNIATY